MVKKISNHENAELMNKNREVSNWMHVYYRPRIKQANVFILAHLPQVRPLATPNQRDKFRIIQNH